MRGAPLALTKTQRVDQRGVRTPRRGAPLIRQASAWRPGAAPEQLALQDLERAEAIRWVDVYGADLTPMDASGLLAPVCHRELTPRMVRDLVTASLYPAGKDYRGTEVAITAAFSIRRANGASAASVFDPVHVLVGRDWLITCWLPPRAIRADEEAPGHPDASSAALYEAVAETWRRTEGESAHDLAALVRRELAIACGYRPRI